MQDVRNVITVIKTYAYAVEPVINTQKNVLESG